RRRWREDWIAYVDRLLQKLRDWVTEAQAADLLDLETLEFEKREQSLGAYPIKGLAIHFRQPPVKVVRVGGTVGAHLGPYAEPGNEKAEGRVDITNGTYKYYLYLKLNDAGEEQWFVQDERSGIRPLDRERFEAILRICCRDRFPG